MDYAVGDLVRLPAYWQSELGVIYELYKDFDDATKRGVSILTESGRDLGGFSWDESQRYLKLLARTGDNYQFSNVTNLTKDFRAGRFADIFKLGGHDVLNTGVVEP